MANQADDKLKVKEQLEAIFSEEQIDNYKLERLAREVGRSLVNKSLSLSLSEIAHLRVILVSSCLYRDNTSRTSFAKGLLTGINQILSSYPAEVQNQRHRDITTRLVKGACRYGKLLFPSYVGDPLPFPHQLRGHVGKCKSCKLALHRFKNFQLPTNFYDELAD